VSDGIIICSLCNPLVGQSPFNIHCDPGTDPGEYDLQANVLINVYKAPPPDYSFHDALNMLIGRRVRRRSVRLTFEYSIVPSWSPWALRYDIPTVVEGGFDYDPQGRIETAKIVSYRYCHRDGFTCDWLVENTPRVERLNLDLCDSLRSDEPLDQLHRLKTLKVIGLAPLDAMRFDAIASCATLQHLRIDIAITNDDVDALCRLFDRLPHLRTFSVGSRPKDIIESWTNVIECNWRLRRAMRRIKSCSLIDSI
jgi:hypothetical protein